MTTKRKIRLILMIAGPLLVLAVSAALYLHSGRYISTDNAYVKADKIMVSSEVAGTILTVTADDNQFVHAGDVIVTLDPAPYQISVTRAKAQLASTRTKIEELKARYRQIQAQLKSAQINAKYYGTEYSRYAPLVKKGVVARLSVEDIERQKGEAQQLQAQTEQEVQGILAQLDNNPDILPEDHPDYKMALAELEQAERNLSLTTIRAPHDGVTGIMPNPGDYARASLPLFSIVDAGHEWVEANYKETDLTHMRIGQKANIDIDTYPGHTWHGTIESISPATGSEFSVLPAQNATGNWVKVIQRIAVRIRIDRDAESAELPLRAGMSSNVTIDVGFYPHWLKR